MTRSRSLIAGLALLVAAAMPAAADDVAPVLVELFTSQGCSSCPPADALAGRLAARDDVVMLSFHVNYWDYIGWKDPFASEATTRRQYTYATALGERNVYTPQMVIAGHQPVVGSDERAVLQAIAKAAGAAAPGPRITVVRDGDGIRVSLGEGPPPQLPAEVILVRYDTRRETQVERGENAGRTIINHHVVRDFQVIGEWDGSASEITVDAAALGADHGRGGCAVVVQTRDQGPVIAAADFAMSEIR